MTKTEPTAAQEPVTDIAEIMQAAAVKYAEEADYCPDKFMMEEILKALEANGYAIVKSEPTDEMFDAALREAIYRGIEIDEQDIMDIYVALVTAAIAAGNKP